MIDIGYLPCILILKNEQNKIKERKKDDIKEVRKGSIINSNFPHHFEIEILKK